MQGLLHDRRRLEWVPAKQLSVHFATVYRWIDKGKRYTPSVSGATNLPLARLQLRLPTREGKIGDLS